MSQLPNPGNIPVQGHLDPMNPAQNIGELALGGRTHEEALAWIRRDIERTEMDKTLTKIRKDRKIETLRSAVEYVEKKQKEARACPDPK